jgi:hypothetical protein
VEDDDPKAAGTLVVMDDGKSLDGTLKIALDLWRFQIDSYWSRNHYFVTFHSAIMAAVWGISKEVSEHRAPALKLFCWGGMIVSVLWLMNNIREHRYVIYWWDRASAVEELMKQPEGACLFSGSQRRLSRRWVPREYHVWAFPILYFAIWIVILHFCFVVPGI